MELKNENDPRQRDYDVEIDRKVWVQVLLYFWHYSSTMDHAVQASEDN